MTYICISDLAVETYIWKTHRKLIPTYGIDESWRIISPLTWYIRTGRASCDFLRSLMTTKHYLIARDCAKGGSTDEVINRICKRLHYDRA